MQNAGPNGIILKLNKYSNWPSKSVDSSCRMSAKCRLKNTKNSFVFTEHIQALLFFHYYLNNSVPQ